MLIYALVIELTEHTPKLKNTIINRSQYYHIVKYMQNMRQFRMKLLPCDLPG